MTKQLIKTIEKDKWVSELIDRALDEDIGSGDITTELLIDSNMKATGKFYAKQDLIVCGLPIAAEVIKRVDARSNIKILKSEGEKISKGVTLATVQGYYGSLLTSERVALNFLTHLSGIATFTNQFVIEAGGTKAGIYDTRKTIPGLRQLEKYAVKTGGGCNHRIGLYDGILIKNNHISTGKTISELVSKARKNAPPDVFIEVEVETLEQVKEAVVAHPDIIMLDNMNVGLIEQARKLIPNSIEVEVSGNVTLSRIKEISLTGVTRISIGAITHSAQTADISLSLSPLL